ncbi:MAG: TRAP transporter large permease subunit, partial [Candidatus Fonsibacter ubiquis]|nr:TRAP transporter large permease subunit [Candidatus Fonsibacter ubiquis]
ITMIIYGISTGTSIGKLFIAGIIPGIMLTALFMIWAFVYARINREGSEKVEVKEYTWKQRFEILPKIIPFFLLVVGVLYVLYGGIATPNEASAVGALISVILVAVVYKMYDFKNIWAILEESMKESVIAKEMVEIAANKWLLMLYINLFLLVAGCFLPPVAIILMTAPILYPIITAAGFDPIWFGVIMTINMEIGLITPPVGLNLFVIQGIAPDISIGKILKGSFPFVLLMILQIVLLCIFPEIATWLPSTVMK